MAPTTITYVAPVPTTGEEFPVEIWRSDLAGSIALAVQMEREICARIVEDAPREIKRAAVRALAARIRARK